MILSHPVSGEKPEWGLTDLGSAQAESAGELFNDVVQEDGVEPDAIVIFSSPFSRAVETAARIGSHVQIHLHDDRMKKSEALRERYFGSELEGKCASSCYGKVWEEDEKNSLYRPGGGDGESVADVAGRVRQFVYDVEDVYSGCYVVVVSHGDSLSILTSVLKEEDVRTHRRFGLKNCEMYRIDAS